MPARSVHPFKPNILNSNQLSSFVESFCDKNLPHPRLLFLSFKSEKKAFYTSVRFVITESLMRGFGPWKGHTMVVQFKWQLAVRILRERKPPRGMTVDAHTSWVVE